MLPTRLVGSLLASSVTNRQQSLFRSANPSVEMLPGLIAV